MTTTNDTPSTGNEHEISQLVVNARDIGEPDHYSGKRSWVRYQAGMQLEVTTDLTDLSDVQAATMHNVSGGGFSFWSRKELLERTAIYLREFSDHESGEWVRATVRHCTVGIRGFLVGAEFEDSMPEDDAPEVECAEVEAPAGEDEPVPSTPPREKRGWFGRRRGG